MTAEMVPNPYAAELGSRDPLEALSDTPDRIQTLVSGWSRDQFERSYAPGKWSARQILIHLAQTELALSTRARFALTIDGHAAASFSQDDWMRIEQTTEAIAALEAYVALRRVNVALWRSLTAEQRARRFTHAEYGPLTVWWIVRQMAGHEIRHLGQLERISHHSPH